MKLSFGATFRSRERTDFHSGIRWKLFRILQRKIYSLDRKNLETSEFRRNSDVENQSFFGKTNYSELGNPFLNEIKSQLILIFHYSYAPGGTWNSTYINISPMAKLKTVSQVWRELQIKLFENYCISGRSGLKMMKSVTKLTQILQIYEFYPKNNQNQGKIGQ